MIIYNAKAIPFFVRLELSDGLKFVGLTLYMPPVIALNQAFWQEDFFPPRKIALCGCLGCYPIFKGLFMFLVKASQKKYTNKPKRCSRLSITSHLTPFLIFLVLLGSVIQLHKTFLAKWRLYFTF